MRYLGIDYGAKRIGIAVSDETGTFAFPRATFENSDGVFEQIKKTCAKEQVATVVLGVPMPFGGVPSEQTKEAMAFGEELKKALTIPVTYENEIFTTKIAKDGGAKAHNIDQNSAALILQGYLDRVRKVV